MSSQAVTPPTDDNFDVPGDIVSCPYYYTYVPATAGYTNSDNVFVPGTPAYYTDNNGDDILDYNFADKISVGGGSDGTSYSVEVDLGGATGGVDDVLFFGTVSGDNVIPKAVALECAAFFGSQVIDLSAGPMSYSRYVALGSTARKTGAYLLTMTGASFEAHLAQMDFFKSIAMVDISQGIAVLENNIGILADYVEIAGGGLHIQDTLTYAGDMTDVQGILSIGSYDIGVFTGVLNDLSKVGGVGTLEIVGGKFSVADGAEVDVATWLSKGTSAKEAWDYIDTTLDYKGDFVVGADTTTIFYKGSSLTVREVNNINGLGGNFDLSDWDGVRNGDETLDVLGLVAKGETFSIGETDTLVLGSPVKFNGVIDHMTTGTNGDADDSYVPHAGGEVALVGIWNFVSVASNSANTETVVTMKDVANGLLAHIDFADINAGTMIPSSYFEFFDQLKGVTPTTVITPTVPPPII